VNITVRRFQPGDIPGMLEIWNEIIEAGQAFPQEDFLDEETGCLFFSEQDHSAVAVDDKSLVLGLYILHPNNVGRCGHLANASYAVREEYRDRGIGRLLVEDSLIEASRLGFRIMQFNAVVANNEGAMHLYESLGFVRLGLIPGGFRLKDGRFEDMYPYYKILEPVSDNVGDEQRKK